MTTLAKTYHNACPNPDGRDNRILLAVDPNLEQVLAAILDALEVEAVREAVRLLTEAISQHALPEKGNLGHWLREAIGPKMIGRLIEALVVHPCFYCGHGHGPCQDCGGRGRTEDGQICGRCLGIGQEFCEFCNGSGLVAIEFVPKDLQLAVVLTRVRRAACDADVLLKSPLPGLACGDLRRAARECARILIDLNRLMGVMENAFVAIQGSAPSPPSTADLAERITGTCKKAGAKLTLRIRRVLYRMAGIAARWAKEASNPVVRDASMQRATYYRSLVKNDLVRCALEHPLLPKPR